MSSAIVTGYYNDGVAYAMHLDTETKTDLTGVIEAGPADLISAIEAATGESATLHPTGADQTIGVDTIEGVLAYLIAHTQIVDMSGDLPDDLVSDPEEPLNVVH